MTELPLRITRLSWRGEGMAEDGGQRLLVPGSLPGEEVLAAGSGERLTLERVISPSPDRVVPLCRHFGQCGGCQLQHWADAPYRAWKAALVTEALKARGIAGSVAPALDAHGAGRRRAILHVRRGGGQVTAGFMAARSHRLLDIDACPVLEAALAPAFGIARALGEDLGDCDVAVTTSRGGLDVSVKAARAARDNKQGELAALMRSLGLARLSVNGEIIATANPPRLALGRAEVIPPPGGFLQATALGEETLARLVTDHMGKAKQVADLFCGIGPFSFRLAETARVEAYDSDRAAIAALSAAVKATSGLKPMTATARDLFREPLVPNELKHFDAVVFDPPRAGAEAQARQLARSQVKTVVAVSCDPVSFARDAEILVSGGYKLQQVTAVDQFKWSSHVEIAALFSRQAIPRLA
jgi:23S rRNA (uracil1939-C5)-methyltransferase